MWLNLVSAHLPWKRGDIRGRKSTSIANASSDHVGLLHGFLNGTAMAQAGGGTVALLGIATAVFVIVALVAGFAVSLHATWARVAVRVAGSWIAAIGLLMLGGRSDARIVAAMPPHGKTLWTSNGRHRGRAKRYLDQHHRHP